MTPLPSLGLTPGWPQGGASSAAPEQPGLFDLVLSLKQQGSGTEMLHEGAATEARVACSPTASPVAQAAPIQSPALQICVAQMLSAAPAAVTGGHDAPVERGVTTLPSVGAEELPPSPALAPNNNTSAAAESAPQAHAVVPYVARTLAAAFAKPLAPADDRMGPDEATGTDANETASMPLMAQIWAVVSVAKNGRAETSAKGQAGDVSLGEREPFAGGPPVFLSGKGAKIAADLIKLPLSDGRPGKNVKETVESLLDTLPTPISHVREQVSLNAQQQGPGRNEHAGVARPQFAPDIDTKQLDLLMRDISELTSTAGKAAFHLSSEHLGRLQVRLETTDVGVSVAIRTDNERGHVAVSQAQKQLQDDLHANGLKVAETSVALGQNGAEQQRSDRNAHVRIAPRIEVALEQSAVPDENQDGRPDGRFA